MLINKKIKGAALDVVECEEYLCQNYKRYFPGEILTFPGMSKNVVLFDYQKDARNLIDDILNVIKDKNIATFDQKKNLIFYFVISMYNEVNFFSLLFGLFFLIF